MSRPCASSWACPLYLWLPPQTETISNANGGYSISVWMRLICSTHAGSGLCGCHCVLVDFWCEWASLRNRNVLFWPGPASGPLKCTLAPTPLHYWMGVVGYHGCLSLGLHEQHNMKAWALGSAVYSRPHITRIADWIHNRMLEVDSTRWVWLYSTWTCN